MSPDARYLFIVNPVSGTRKGKDPVLLIRELMDRYGEKYEITETKHKGHATALAAEAVKNGIPIVVAVGGDGTLNEIAQVLKNTNVTLGVVPRGSGNGLARFAGIPTDTGQALQVLLQGKQQRIDTVLLNGKFFISIAGLGFDAEVALHFNRSKRRGFIRYGWIAVREFFRYRPHQYEIEHTGDTTTARALLISFANSDRFGYNAVIAPQSDLTDGLVDLCILRKPPILMAVFLLGKFFRKKIHHSRYMQILKVSSAKITCRPETLSHIDGDTGTAEKEVIVEVCPSSLNLIIP